MNDLSQLAAKLAVYTIFYILWCSITLFFLTGLIACLRDGIVKLFASWFTTLITYYETLMEKQISEVKKHNDQMQTLSKKMNVN